ncbi:DNA alkylation repair protein [Jannaschia sp. 2305UL9-9]|uniref:DNA alkylation repair protein n=1 Tax=Jannaschia sp. 2305UL9-9 TaxID=3121638 RepID=UPI0035278653
MTRKKDGVVADMQAAGDPERAARDKASNRTDRDCWGVPAGVLNDTAKALRDDLSVDHRVLIADALWRAEVFDLRLLALKLLTQARIRPDDGVWALLERWVHQLDCRALADAHAAAAGRRLVALPARLEVVEDWTDAASIWTRRAALEATRPWAKMNNPSEAEREVRDHILGWVAAMAEDARPLIRQAVDGWLRDLAKRDPERAAAVRDQSGSARL